MNARKMLILFYLRSSSYLDIRHRVKESTSHITDILSENSLLLMTLSAKKSRKHFFLQIVHRLKKNFEKVYR